MIAELVRRLLIKDDGVRRKIRMNERRHERYAFAHGYARCGPAALTDTVDPVEFGLVEALNGRAATLLA